MNEQKPKDKKTKDFSVRVPTELHSKIEYIKKRSFLSKQRILLICAQNEIELWFKKLAEEEIQNRVNRSIGTNDFTKNPLV